MAEDDTLAAQDTPIITSRSMMVGDARRDSYRSQEGDGVTFDTDRNESETNSVRPGGLNISQVSREQAQSAARRSRVRSDEETLALSVADAGLNAFGCVFVEMWTMSDDGTKLTRPSGGHWMDPSFALSLPDVLLIEKAWELDREARDCPLGAGLAGTLAEEASSGARHVHWRQIKSLMTDPFVQRGSGKRMERFFDLGIGLVAAVPFSFQDHSGIVIYFSRSTANVKLLRAASNERYLIASADLIGASFSIRKARNECAELRKSMYQEAIKKVRKELFNKKRSIASVVLDPNRMDELKKLREREAAQDQTVDLRRVDKFAVKLAKKIYKLGKRGLKRANNSRRKWRGAKLHGPPRQSFSDCLFTFTGAFLTMLTLLKIAISIQTDSNFDFLGNWYSSTLCIVYALTPAPVGQPRQILAAHLWNMLVGLACRQIPTGGFNEFMESSGASPGTDYGMPLIWRQSLAVALGISGQAYIGIIHPPATGLSFTFASGPQYSGGTMLSVMMADFVVIVMSMMILNLSEKKQYPLYWLGLGWGGSGGSIGFVRNKAKSIRRAVSNVTNSARGSKGEESV